MELKELYKIGLKRDVVIFGTGHDAEIFYQKYQKDICDSFCYDNVEKESFHGIPVKKPKRKPVAENSKELIVVCSGKYKKEIEEQLLQLGYEVLVDFITDKWFQFFMEEFDPEKKNAFFYGTCHSNAIMNGMSLVPDFYNQYNYIHSRVTRDDLVDVHLTELALLQCDVVIYNQYVGNKVDKMDTKAVKIGFPYIYFWTYWPQIDIKNKHNIFHIPGKGSDGILHRGDTFMNDMIFQGKSEDEIMSYITSDDVISREEVIKRQKKNFSFIKVTEKTSAIKISDFFLENYRKFLIYNDYKHLGDMLIREYSRRVLTYMGIKDIRFDNELECYPFTETPIYPSVAKYLDLEMIDNNTKYKVRRSDGTAYLLSFEEFEREYIRRCKENLSKYDLDGKRGMA